ncbi:MAG TPA: hemolysin family protein [Oscillospiraceae bacterium]|nr:hemolysin family protein [Oscillospiraceae bacterium]
MDTTATILVMLVLLTFSAYFSATETAFNTASQTKLKIEADKGNGNAALALRLLDSYDKLLSTILVGNNIVNIALTAIATVFFVNYIGDSGATVSTAVMTVVVLFFGEITPKSLAKEYPETFTKFSAPILHGIMLLLTPVNWIFSAWKKFISKLITGEDQRGMTGEELMNIVEVAEEEGGICSQESELIRSALEFNDQDAADIATPRVDLAAVPIDATKEEIEKVFFESGYSRLPVYRENIDDIVGFIHQMDFHRMTENPDLALEKILQQPLFVPCTMKIGALLKLLQKAKCHMAIVTDEFGGTFGVVTMEDILEELVGEIWDEHDEVVEDFVKKEDGYHISGSADPEEMFEYLGLEERVDSATVSGWVMDELGKVPEKGDSFVHSGMRFTVLETEGMRASEILIQKTE